jgi:hypothetical protein
MTPFMALDKIAIVNGRPTIWGDGAIGLVRGSGLCEWIREKIEGEGDKRVAICEAKRRGEPEPIRGVFSVADAKQAGLWGKQGPWQQYVNRMLQMRARAFCLRDGFADVLGGLYLKEEMDDVSNAPVRDVSPPVPPIPPAIASVPTPALAAPQPPIPPVPAANNDQPEQHIDPEAVIRELADALEAARDAEGVFEAWNDIVSPFLNDLFPPDVSSLEKMRDDKLRRLS